jgi:hypothetical protein
MEQWFNVVTVTPGLVPLLAEAAVMTSGLAAGQLVMHVIAGPGGDKAPRPELSGPRS